jgi:hypothetical protein
MQKLALLSILLCSIFSAQAQPQNRWQQAVDYKMVIDMNVTTNQFTGKQRLEYTNNSDQTLNKVFYHLYFNAFQPNSSMDVRSRELGKQSINGRADWDARVRDRISKLKPDEIGYQKIISLKMNGVAQPFKYHETILEVNLTKAIAPKTKVVFEMEFEAQVPLQVRRSGRDNPTTGVRYSMAQWYPKMCEYDYTGWNANPYIAREFYGVWGNFDVTINIDSSYKLGGTGVLVNANEIGWGYDKPGTALKPSKTAKRKWQFVGKNIHDFVWAADPDYIHVAKQVPNGPMVHVLYNYKPNNAKNDEEWSTIADAAVTVLPFIESKFGKYPYPQYSFIQGGDGGMEYPMATLLIGSGLGTVFHEWMHSWYQMMLGTNESLHGWMDEGFTEFATNYVNNYYQEKVLRVKNANNPAALARYDTINSELPYLHADNYGSYLYLANSGKEEPLTTHADHFNSNFAYSIASYSKGCVFMAQLGYIMGEESRDKFLLEYYNRWRFKHPNPTDLIRVAEDISGLELDWYKEYWVNSTKKIDYAIDSLWEDGAVTNVRLKRIGQLPMPIDVQMLRQDGTLETYTIPLNLMYGAKQLDNGVKPIVAAEPWKWTHPTYTLQIKSRLKDYKAMVIDASYRLADVDRKNNEIEFKW